MPRSDIGDTFFEMKPTISIRWVPFGCLVLNRGCDKMQSCQFGLRWRTGGSLFGHPTTGKEWFRKQFPFRTSH
jgi:hypothetical protein